MDNPTPSTSTSPQAESTSRGSADRVRFATPQAERIYKMILRQQRQNVRKWSRRCLNLLELRMRGKAGLDRNKKSACTCKARTTTTKNSAAAASKKKRRTRAAKKFVDPFIASLGPIPRDNPEIFANMSFIFCYASFSDRCVKQTLECEDTDEILRKQPFWCKERLILQVLFGGGKVYDNFSLVPIEERQLTKLITNAPSFHPQRVLCDEAGIPAYSHRWIIRCCQQNKAVDPTEDEIAAIARKNCDCITCARRRR